MDKTYNSYGAAIRERGATPLELLVAMVIIGPPAGYAGLRFCARIGKSGVKAVKAQLDALSRGLARHRIDVGYFPSTEEGLLALNAAPGGEGENTDSGNC